MRVNVETRAFAESRFRSLMRIMQWQPARTIGTLVILWHDSQEALKAFATREEINSWLEGDSDDELDKLFMALLQTKYIVRSVREDLFEIRGNKKHVEAHQQRAVAAAKGGKKSGQARRSNSPKKSNGSNGNEARASEKEASGSKNEPNAVQSIAAHNIAAHSTTQRSVSDQEQLIPLEPIQAPRPEKSSTRVAPKAIPRGAVPEFNDHRLTGLLEGVSENLQRVWIQNYGDVAWLNAELLKAHVWCTANPQKRPKDFGKFMSNWLNKGWESHRKGIPSRRLTSAEVNQEAARDLWQRNEQGNL